MKIFSVHIICDPISFMCLVDKLSLLVLWGGFPDKQLSPEYVFWVLVYYARLVLFPARNHSVVSP